MVYLVNYHRSSDTRFQTYIDFVEIAIRGDHKSILILPSVIYRFHEMRPMF